MIRRSIQPVLLIATALALLAGQVDEAIVLPALAGLLGGTFSWALGFHQGRRHGWALAQRWQARRVLEAFTHAAEQTLANAPDDLDEQGEARRDELQRHYHEAQEQLAQLEDPRR